VIQFPVYSESVLFHDRVTNISVVGTVHDHRHRWNPFAEENEMTRSAKAGEWVKWIKLSNRGGRNQDGVYNNPVYYFNIFSVKVFNLT
jgi:hypothetical protein